LAKLALCQYSLSTEQAGFCGTGMFELPLSWSIRRECVEIHRRRTSCGHSLLTGSMLWWVCKVIREATGHETAREGGVNFSGHIDAWSKRWGTFHSLGDGTILPGNLGLASDPVGTSPSISIAKTSRQMTSRGEKTPESSPSMPAMERDRLFHRNRVLAVA
jgi:hypothetical protein